MQRVRGLVSTIKIEHLSNDLPLVVGILLSERNLQSLLDGLRSHPSVERSFLRHLDTTTVVVMAEKDDVHYADTYTEPEESAA